MKKIYLIRHAQSESNAGLAIRPNHLINLTHLGNTQAVALADWLIDNIHEPIDGVFISAYARTQQTALPFLQKTGKTAQILEDLHEFNYLDFERIKDLNLQDLRTLACDFWTKGSDYQDSDVTDSFDNFIKRVKNVRVAFDDLPDGTYIVFTHGMWIGMLIWQLVHGDSLRVQNMTNFREFELTVRPKNCEVFLLQNGGIRKVRVRHDSDNNPYEAD